MMLEQVRVNVTPTEHVTAIVYSAAVRDRADISLILAHGAGGNQTSAFIVHFATALAARGIDTVTFNFVYSEEGKRLPDRNDKLETCWRKVIEAFHGGVFCHHPDRRKLVIGGKSMGGRIASQVVGANGDGIAGLVFLGYPVHPPGRPDKSRTTHLPGIHLPMLFVQGSRDAFGAPDELTPIIANLTPPTKLYIVEGGDHSFKVPKKAAASQEQVYNFVIDEIEHWLRNAMT
jgi:predicted alpha/beta-hydrolase family hydrolase